MSLQSMLNEEAFKYVPKISELIKRSSGVDRDQMIEESLRQMLLCNPSVSEMNESQIDKFETNLIERFKFCNWI